MIEIITEYLETKIINPYKRKFNKFYYFEYEPYKKELLYNIRSWFYQLPPVNFIITAFKTYAPPVRIILRIIWRKYHYPLAHYYGNKYDAFDAQDHIYVFLGAFSIFLLLTIIEDMIEDNMFFIHTNLNDEIYSLRLPTMKYRCWYIADCYKDAVKSLTCIFVGYLMFIGRHAKFPHFIAFDTDSMFIFTTIVLIYYIYKYIQAKRKYESIIIPPRRLGTYYYYTLMVYDNYYYDDYYDTYFEDFIDSEEEVEDWDDDWSPLMSMHNFGDEDFDTTLGVEAMENDFEDEYIDMFDVDDHYESNINDVAAEDFAEDFAPLNNFLFVTTPKDDFYGREQQIEYYDQDFEEYFLKEYDIYIGLKYLDFEILNEELDFFDEEVLFAWEDIFDYNSDVENFEYLDESGNVDYFKFDEDRDLIVTDEYHYEIDYGDSLDFNDVTICTFFAPSEASPIDVEDNNPLLPLVPADYAVSDNLNQLLWRDEDNITPHLVEEITREFIYMNLSYMNAKDIDVMVEETNFDVDLKKVDLKKKMSPNFTKEQKDKFREALKQKVKIAQRQREFLDEMIEEWDEEMEEILEITVDGEIMHEANAQAIKNKTYPNIKKWSVKPIKDENFPNRSYLEDDTGMLKLKVYNTYYSKEYNDLKKDLPIILENQAKTFYNDFDILNYVVERDYRLSGGYNTKKEGLFSYLKKKYIYIRSLLIDIFVYITYDIPTDIIAYVNEVTFKYAYSYFYSFVDPILEMYGERELIYISFLVDVLHQTKFNELEQKYEDPKIQRRYLLTQTVTYFNEFEKIQRKNTISTLVVPIDWYNLFRTQLPYAKIEYDEKYIYYPQSYDEVEAVGDYINYPIFGDIWNFDNKKNPRLENLLKNRAEAAKIQKKEYQKLRKFFKNMLFYWETYDSIDKGKKL